jgi:hypothetical protein
MSANEKPIKSKELIVLESTKKIVEFNKTFEQLKDEVIEQLKENKYNSIITLDNFDVMKKTSQELGKIAEYVSRFRIDKVREESVEIQNFEKNFKELTKIIEAKQETIKEGLSVFEELTRKQINLVCEDYLTTQIETLKLRLEFQNIDISDMTQRKFMTGTGAISAAGKAEIESRVNLKLALQNKVDLRLSNLENICHRAGIEPLLKEHIQGFLFDDDESYNKKLDSLVETEIKRSETAKKKTAEEERIKAEQEARQKLKDEQEAFKRELTATYTDRIKNATLSELITINLDLKAYEDYATYELKKLCNQRQLEIENQNKPAPVDETPQEEHLKSITKEPVREVVKEVEQPIKKEVPVVADEKVTKTISMEVNVKATVPDELVLKHIFGLIGNDVNKFIEMFKVS